DGVGRCRGAGGRPAAARVPADAGGVAGAGGGARVHGSDVGRSGATVTRAQDDAPRGEVHGFRSDGGRAWLSGLSLDLRLAWRMLLKSPGLTVVGVLGIAIGTALGVGAFVVLTGLFYPKLPLDEGERVVALTMLDVESGRPARQLVHEFATW